MKWTKIVLSAVLCVAFLTQPALAATDNSNADIEFEEGTGPTQPVDPEDPKTPIDPEDPGVTGSLAIVYTTPFNFGKGKISITKQTYNVQSQRPNIQVVDLRGSNTGWTLTASVNGFKDASDNASLPGSFILFNNGNLNSESPLANGPTVKTGVRVATDGSPEIILEAGEGKGGGLWVNRFYPPSAEENSYVQLEVAAGSGSLGTHSATILWTLEDTP